MLTASSLTRSPIGEGIMYELWGPHPERKTHMVKWVAAYPWGPWRLAPVKKPSLRKWEWGSAMVSAKDGRVVARY